MTESTAVLPASKPLPPATGFVKTVLLCLPMLLISALFILKGKQLSQPYQIIPAVLTYGFVNATFFLMLYTGRTHTYRSRFFILASVLFVISFVANLIEVRGTMELSVANMLDGETPLCPLVIPMLIIPAALTGTIIFPGSFFAAHAGIAAMIVLWLGFSLSIGRGWCSWVCFFGGMDEGCSRLCNKSKISTPDKKWTYLPWAVLLVVVLTSAISLSPTYCAWLCPFKAVTEFPAVNSAATILQAFIFVSLFVALVIVLPIRSGRRTQCGLFCPFGAFQSLFNKLNVFEVRIRKEQCVGCNLCINQCPTFSLDEQSLSAGKTLMTCTKCGKCVDNCPGKAIDFHIKGTPLNVSLPASRILFIYSAFIFAAAVGGGCIYGGLERVFRLLFTGSMIS